MIEFLKQLDIKALTHVQEFQHKHRKCYAGAIGGGISYIITPTGIGDLYSVKCNICNVELTLNELDM